MEVNEPGNLEHRDARAEVSVSPGLSSRNGLRKLKRVACKGCRQAKSRCDVSIGSSASCSRCRRLKRECHIDVIYKRANKTLKLHELAQQVQQLQSVVGPILPATDAIDIPATNVVNEESLRLPQVADSNSFVSGAFSNRNIFQSQGSDSRMELIHDANPLESRPLISQTLTTNSLHQASVYQPTPAAPPQSYGFEAFANPATRARSIDHVNLNPEQINDLFRIYFEHYHPFFCILDPKNSPEEHFTRSPLLFWTVIGIASRRFEDDPTLFEMLSRSVTTLAWTSISVLPHTRFIVQAIVLLCMWPFPASSMWMDPSFMFISIAKCAALQMGLHRPERIQDFSRTKYRLSPDEVQEITKIWSGCYIAGQCISSASGQEPLFKADRTVDRACELGSHYSLPDDLRYQLVITRFSTRVSTMMSEKAQDDFGLPSDERNSILTTLENDLDAISGQLEGKITVLNQIWLSCARLQLRVFYFFETSDVEVRKRGLLRAFETASSLISQITADDANSRLMAYAPLYIYRMLILAAIILLKILNSIYAQYVDCVSGKRLFTSSLVLLRRCSLENNDNIGRASKILNQLWGVQKSLAVGGQEPSLRVRTRLGASILHDTLWLWRQEFGGQENAYRTIPGSDTATLDQNPASPKAPELMSSNSTVDTINSDDMSSFTNGLDSDTDWMVNLGLRSFTPHDIDFSSVFRLPASHLSQKL